MNLPVHALAAMAPLSPFDAFLHMFNNNPYFIGLMMLILNVGGRFIGMEVTKQQEQFLQHPWVRRVIIFIAIFIATRNIWVAFWTTVVVVLLLGYLFNENSALCIFGKGGTRGSTCATEQKGEMTPEEREILQRLHSKAQRYASVDSAESMKEVADAPYSDIYRANMALLKK